MIKDWNIEGPIVPILAALALTAAALGAPYMTLLRTQDGGNIDSYTFYLWGQQYKVVGPEKVQTVTTTYSPAEFFQQGSVAVGLIPVTLLVLAGILGLVALFASRSLSVSLGGRRINLAVSIDPTLPLAGATGLLLMGYFWTPQLMRQAVQGTEYSIGMEIGNELLLGAALLYGLAFVIHATRLIRRQETEVRRA